MIGLLAFSLLAAPLSAQPAGTALVSSSSAPRGIGLTEAFTFALQRNERLAQDREAVNEALSRIDELWSLVKPRISLVGSEIIQDSPGASAGAVSSFSQRYRPQAGFSAHQPLFSGLREYLAVKAARAQSESATLDLRRAESRLYEDVAAAYLGLLGVQKEIAARREIADLTGDRIKELRQRVGVGRSRKSEVLAAESQLSQVESDLAATLGRERVAQFNLRFVTGLDTDLGPADVSVDAPADLDSYLGRSLSRADIEARRRDLDAARFGVDIQRRQSWPTLFADGNYYLKRPDGFQKDIKWDATLSASLPLFSGGGIAAQTEQARARSRSAELALGLARRRAETEVRSSYDDLRSTLHIVQALERSLDLARKNAEAQSADYRLGLVTNLDVLNALNAVQATRLTLDRARLDAVAAQTRLEVACGGPQAP